METKSHRYYHLRLAAAYTRGKQVNRRSSTDLSEKPLADLSHEDCERLFEHGRDAGLKLHRFKRSVTLLRVRRILSVLKGLRPANLLDISTGRVVFLWSLLDTFPLLPVTCIDRLDFRSTDIHAVAKGGTAKLQKPEAFSLRQERH